MLRLLASHVVGPAAILAVAVAPLSSVLAAAAITPAQAQRIVGTVMDEFRPAIGSYSIQTFDDVPQETSKEGVKTPIVIVVGDSRTEPVPGVYSNCTADSSTRTIRCDLRLLDDLIDEFGIIYSENQRDAAREHVLQLVLAHELGHIINRDGSAAYHGTGKGFSVFRYLHYKVELRADAFAVGLIDRYAKDRDLEYGAIVDLASGAVKRSLCPFTFPKPCPCFGYTKTSACQRFAEGPGLPILSGDEFPITLAGTHPDFVVRFARLLYLSRDPKTHGLYWKAARQVLLHVVVRDEGGQLESTAALFQ